jgi:predicted phage terminase large subunit-like protein
MATVELSVEEIDAAIERRKNGERLAEEADRLAHDLRAFIRAAWHVVVPNTFVSTWHVDSLADHLQALYEREITRLVVTIPPGSLKSTIVSVLAPAWRWVNAPDERFVSASYSDEYAERDTRNSRTLIQSAWFRARFGDRFQLAADENLKTRYSNDQGGYRRATHVGGGTGARGGVLLLDDPHNAKEAQSEGQLQTARQWWGDTWSSRLDDHPEQAGIMAVIGQRISEQDLIGMLLEDAGRWTHLCLPARYEPNHPYVYPATARTAGGREMLGDPRAEDGELLAPNYQTEARLAELATDMTAHVAAAQLQQRPAPREGALLKRGDWRYYAPALSFYRRDGQFDRVQAAKLADVAHLTQIVHSWDTSLKDGADNDYVAGQVWGIAQADRYLLRIFKARMGLNGTIEAMRELAAWAHGIWPNLPHRILIETAANGPDAIAEMKARVDGVVAIKAAGKKELRAAAATPALESGNCYLPGYGNADLSGYTDRTPAAVQDFVESCSVFPNGAHDDDVDAWSQMVNWTRGNQHRPARTARPQGRIPTTAPRRDRLAA